MLILVYSENKLENETTFIMLTNGFGANHLSKNKINNPLVTG